MDLHDQNVDGDMVDSMIDSGLPHQASSTELHSRRIINVYEGFELQITHPILQNNFIFKQSIYLTGAIQDILSNTDNSVF